MGNPRVHGLGGRRRLPRCLLFLEGVSRCDSWEDRYVFTDDMSNVHPVALATALKKLFAHSDALARSSPAGAPSAAPCAASFAAPRLLPALTRGAFRVGAAVNATIKSRCSRLSEGAYSWWCDLYNKNSKAWFKERKREAVQEAAARVSMQREAQSMGRA